MRMKPSARVADLGRSAEMNATRFIIAPVASLAFAVAAQALGYGTTFAATSLALQTPLLVLVWAFAALAERRKMKKAFFVSSVVVSVIFLLSGMEDISLCLQFGVLHSSDSGWAALGVQYISATIFVLYAFGFLLFFWYAREKKPNQPLTQRRGADAPQRG